MALTQTIGVLNHLKCLLCYVIDGVLMCLSQNSLTRGSPSAMSPHGFFQHSTFLPLFANVPSGRPLYAPRSLRSLFAPVSARLPEAFSATAQTRSFAHVGVSSFNFLPPDTQLKLLRLPLFLFRKCLRTVSFVSESTELCWEGLQVSV